MVRTFFVRCLHSIHFDLVAAIVLLAKREDRVGLCVVKVILISAVNEWNEFKIQIGGNSFDLKQRKIFRQPKWVWTECDILNVLRAQLMYFYVQSVVCLFSEDNLFRFYRAPVWRCTAHSTHLVTSLSFRAIATGCCCATATAHLHGLCQFQCQQQIRW